MATTRSMQARCARISGGLGVAGASALLAVLPIALPRSGSGAGPESGFGDPTKEAIAWVHRFDGAAEDGASEIEIRERHLDGTGVEWTLVRCVSDGRLALVERPADGDCWWLHAEARPALEGDAARLPDPRSRTRWRMRPGIRSVPLPAGGVRQLRDQLQRWRQRSAG